MALKIGRRRLIVALAGILVCAGPVLAQTVFPVKFNGVQKGSFKARQKVAIASYQINYITEQQATAVGGINARVRVNAVLTGVSEQVMRRLADEGYADLKAKLAAASIPLADEAAVRTALQGAGLEMAANNTVRSGNGPGITIGNSVRRQWVAYGAAAAPSLSAYQNLESVNGLAPGLKAVGSNGKFAGPARSLDTNFLMPSLTVDFVKLSASSGTSITGQRANAGGSMGFSVAMTSPVMVIMAANAGPSYPGLWSPDKEHSVDTPFAGAQTGAANVRQMATGDSRGDAVVVDLPVWEGLVRQAFKDYNTAIVEAVVRARG